MKQQLFSEAQLDELRAEYGAIDKMTIESGMKLATLLDAANVPIWKQLYAANIKWISSLSLNRLIRAKAIPLQ